MVQFCIGCTLGNPLLLDVDVSISHFNFFDVFLITVVAFSMIVGFFRGFVRECFSLLAWGFSLFVALRNPIWPKVFLEQWIHDETILSIVSCASVFFVCLFVCLFITQFISSYVQNSMARSIDRSLGIVFGLVRGSFLIVLCYSGSFFLISNEQIPPILKMSRSLPFLKKGALFVEKMIPQEWVSGDSQRASLFRKNITQILEDELETQKVLDHLSDPLIEKD